MNIFKTKYFWAMTFLLLSCSPSPLQVKEFSLCQQLADEKCIPPLVLTQSVYYFSNPNVSSSLQDYFDSLITAQKNLAFEIKFNRNFTKEEKIDLQKNITAFYSIKNSPHDSKKENVNSKKSVKKNLFSDLRVYKNSITAFVSVGEIFSTAFASALQTPYKKLEPVRIAIEVYRKKNVVEDSKNKTGDVATENQERLVKRTINVEVYHEIRK